MKQLTPYIILLFVAAAVAGILLTGDNKGQKEFDQRITLRKRDKIPYGAHIAFESLKYMFPKAIVSVNKNEPGDWDSLSSYSDKQALIILSPQLNATEYELKKIIRFIENGNDVFISSRSFSGDFEELTGIETTIVSSSPPGDKMTVQLAIPPFREKGAFSYDGAIYTAQVLHKNHKTTWELGSDEWGKTNFMRLQAGKGNLYIHTAPLAFSNYFLLQGNNMQYYENVLSVIPADVTRVVWDEYYLDKRYYYDQPEESQPGWMSVLFKYDSLKWALLTAMLTLLLYVLMEMRRKQRYIPPVNRPRNDSLDFVKTIGRLYHDKGDHANLCRKMGAYFLEHVRNKYKLTTGTLDEAFIQKLQFKTGCDEQELRDIVMFIEKLKGPVKLHHKEMAAFHRKLETFYQKA